MVRSPLVRLDQHEELAEDPRQVSPIDLVDDEDVGGTRPLSGALAELQEHAFPQGEAARFIGPVALDEVLVGIGLVELDHLDRGVVLPSREAPGDAAGDKGLADSGRPLEDEVLPAPDRGDDAAKRVLAQEQILESSGLVVWRFGVVDLRQIPEEVLGLESLSDVGQFLVECDAVERPDRSNIDASAFSQIKRDLPFQLGVQERLEVLGKQEKQEDVPELPFAAAGLAVEPVRKAERVIEQHCPFFKPPGAPAEHDLDQIGELAPLVCVVAQSPAGEALEVDS